MMIDASITVRPASTSTGKRFSGHSAASSCIGFGSSCASTRYANGVPFSYSAVSTFWQ